MGSSRSVRVVVLAVGVMAALAACAGASGPPPGQGQQWGPPPEEGGATACNPDECTNFCYFASCMTDDMGSTNCMAGCTANCGNGFFDDEDAAMMACVAEVGPDLMCENAAACCSNHFTSELCP